MDLITKKEAQEILKVSERTLNSYISQGLLTAYYPGGISGKSVRLKKSDVLNFFKPATTDLING